MAWNQIQIPSPKLPFPQSGNALLIGFAAWGALTISQPVMLVQNQAAQAFQPYPFGSLTKVLPQLPQQTLVTKITQSEIRYPFPTPSGVVLPTGFASWASSSIGQPVFTNVPKQPIPAYPFPVNQKGVVGFIPNTVSQPYITIPQTPVSPKYPFPVPINSVLPTGFASWASSTISQPYFTRLNVNLYVWNANAGDLRNITLPVLTTGMRFAVVPDRFQFDQIGSSNVVSAADFTGGLNSILLNTMPLNASLSGQQGTKQVDAPIDSPMRLFSSGGSTFYTAASFTGGLNTAVLNTTILNTSLSGQQGTKTIETPIESHMQFRVDST